MIEPQFYQLLMEKAQLNVDLFAQQNNKKNWPELKRELETVFKSKTQTQWCELMEGSDVCFAPVLNLNEAQQHPHNIERKTYIEVAGMMQPAPAPRFSRTPPEVQFGARANGEDTKSVLANWGFSSHEITKLKNGNGIS